jgi:hypothetical protein
MASKDEILMELGRIWLSHPDWRFGQLIENAFSMKLRVDHGILHHDCIYSLEDYEALESLERMR